MLSDPLNVDATYIHALCMYEIDWKKAIKHLKDVLIMEPNHYKAKSMLQRIETFKENEKLGNDIVLI